ncbi:unnamed protein product [Aphanomyces euteiches]|uniref:C2 domain-containing protein n=2 Tax=Aphanomyces euteiches TaxID=100861 RepID=A0A6G0W650_9STRA|nr:hypothetical protein Ae201684_018302 [Aphanomyces euteiches]KAH9082857.1 hypothetical protein Ae201684P_013762 [Aphanomyces euteiches]KAH9137328.1 hypothetical protein AeRB84_017878 [Aphanomyces euteiches]
MLTPLQLFRPATSSTALQFPAPTASTKRHLRIVLDHATDLPVGDTTSSDPYVVMECGRHKVCSPIVHGSLNPNWQRDHFEFVLTEAELLEKPSLRFTIMDYDLTSSDDALGTCVVDMTQYSSAATSLDKVAIQAFPIEKATNVASQERNPQLHVGLAWLTEADATATYLMQVWENERWHPTSGWSHTHLTPSKDPAAWTPTEDRHDVQGGDKFNDAIGPVPNGYVEKAPWSVHVSFGDNDGWLYSATFAGPWHVAPKFTSVVRRRLWARQYDRKFITP